MRVIYRSRRTGLKGLAALFIIAGVVSAGLLATQRAHADTAVTPADACFQFNAGTGTITGYYNTEGNVPAAPSCPRAIIIPTTIGGVAVTGTSAYSLAGKSLTVVELPNSLTNLGDGTFNGNLLTSLTLPSTITSIPADLVSYNQLTAIDIPSSVTSIGAGAFAGNQLTSVTIPNGVTSIEFATFYANQLTSVTIPSTVTSIGARAFSHNHLASVTLPEGLQTLGFDVFGFNHLTSVTLPSTLQTMDGDVFFGQNPLDGVVDASSDPAHDMYSSDPAVVQSVYDSFWYVQLYTANPSNPNGFQDQIMSEDLWSGWDYNNNGTTHDSLGGAIINPANVTVRYVDGNGVQLQAPASSTGVRSSDSTDLLNYLVVSSAIAAPLDPYNPTAQETTDLEAGFAQYYRAGQTKTFTAPTIVGYTTPAAQSVTLTPGENIVTFVYQSPTQGGAGQSGQGTTPAAPNTSVASTATTQNTNVIGTSMLIALLVATIVTTIAFIVRFSRRPLVSKN